MAATLATIQNDQLSLTLHDDGSADFLDKATATQWRMGRVTIQEDGPIDVDHVWLRTGRTMPEKYPGRFRVEKIGHNLFRYTLLGHLRREKGAFTVRITLDGPWAEFRITHIDASLPSLVFPAPIESDSLVISKGVGLWQKKPSRERHFWRFWAHLHMRFVGGLKADNDHGWIAVMTEGYNDGGTMVAEMAAMPGWLQTLGKWQGEKAVRYRFTTGGYVGIAKTYRQYAKDAGLFVSLEDKFKRTPAARNMLGGRLLGIYQGDTVRPDSDEDTLRPVKPERSANAGKVQVDTCHTQAMSIIKEAQTLGMNRGFVVVRGWIKGGYDESHPDIWPPEAAMGSIDHLKSILQLDGTLTVAPHDNYQDIYPQSASWPKGAIITRDGQPMPGGHWAGGQCYIINARDGLRYAKRNWEQIKTLGIRSIFIDTTTAASMFQSWEKGNELTRDQDEQYKRELLQFYKEQGMVLGSEESADFGIPYVDWLENRHERKAGESIPLWPLVFHDAVFCGRYRDPAACEHEGTRVPHWVTDMLWGYFNLWTVRGMEQWLKHKQTFSQTVAADQWLSRIGTSEMISHKYLSDDHQLEQTEFANGAAIVVNYANEDRAVEGRTVPAGRYLIRG